MASPAKKRKLNGGSSNSSSSKPSALPSRGLEYFFSKQSKNNETNNKGQEDHEITDEELARKLQAEWDKEAENAGRASGTPVASGTTGITDAPNIEEPSNISQKSPDIVSETKRIESKGKGTLSLQSVSASADTISENIPFDESPLTFDPAKYVPKLQEHWTSEGGHASYALLTRCFVLVNGTSSRIKIVDTLVNCLRVLIEGDPESLLPAVRPPLPLILNTGGGYVNRFDRSGLLPIQSRPRIYH